jgi:Uri superfamily endonuclease
MNGRSQPVFQPTTLQFDSHLPAKPGAYALLLWLPDDCTLQIGRLGKFEFYAGWYVYLGSAHGPGGLRARLNRHLTGSGSQHWHIDALRRRAQPLIALYCLEKSSYLPKTRQGMKPLECAWSQTLVSQPGAVIPAAGFGSSDCRNGCPAHLVYFG